MHLFYFSLSLSPREKEDRYIIYKFLKEFLYNICVCVNMNFLFFVYIYI